LVGLFVKKTIKSIFQGNVNGKVTTKKTLDFWQRQRLTGSQGRATLAEVLEAINEVSGWGRSGQGFGLVCPGGYGGGF
jgi:hypothetical protein